MSKGSKYSQQFKEDAVRYKKEHPELTATQVAENLGVSLSALKHWIHDAKVNNGSVPSPGSGNYASEEAREIARLKRELQDAKDALEVLKKAISILGKCINKTCPFLFFIPLILLLLFPNNRCIPGRSMSVPEYPSSMLSAKSSAKNLFSFKKFFIHFL